MSSPIWLIPPLQILAPLIGIQPPLAIRNMRRGTGREEENLNYKDDDFLQQTTLEY